MREHNLMAPCLVVPAAAAPGSLVRERKRGETDKARERERREGERKEIERERRAREREERERKREKGAACSRRIRDDEGQGR